MPVVAAVACKTAAFCALCSDSRPEWPTSVQRLTFPFDAGVWRSLAEGTEDNASWACNGLSAERFSSTALVSDDSKMGGKRSTYALDRSYSLASSYLLPLLVPAPLPQRSTQSPGQGKVADLPLPVSAARSHPAHIKVCVVRVGHRLRQQSLRLS